MKQVLTYFRKTAALFCLIALVSGVLFMTDTGNAYAASKPVLSAGKITMVTGSTASLKLRNVSKKVKWESSDKTIVSIVSRKGKYKNKVTLQAGNNPGTAHVTAKTGGKKYRCKVTVKEKPLDFRPLGDSSVDLAADIKHDTSLGTAADSKFIESACDFSVTLMQNIMADDSTRNILISPDSILTAMIMTENGARNNTLKEMENALSGGIDADSYNAYLAGLNNRLCSDKEVIYQQANSIWAKKSALKVSRNFVKKNKIYHNAEFYEAAFDNNTVADINNWVYNNTRNMIDRIVDRLDADVSLVLVNTTAFEGQWMEPFYDPADGFFTTEKGDKRKVKMLCNTDQYRYLELKGGKGFVKPYKGGSIAFAGILPPEGTAIDDYVASLSGKDFAGAWQASDRTRVCIKIPEFKYDYDTMLNKPLQAMGIKEAFTGQADFSGMIDQSVPQDGLMIDSVLHKTHIELDKNGTKAAAVTAVFAKSTSVLNPPKPVEIFLDRPFVYALVDTETGIPLFMGVVRDLQ